MFNRDLATTTPISRVVPAASHHRTLARSSRLFSRHLQTFTPSFGASALLPSSISSLSMVSNSLASLAQPLAPVTEEEKDFDATRIAAFEKVEPSNVSAAETAGNAVFDRMDALHLYALLGLETAPSAQQVNYKMQQKTTKDHSEQLSKEDASMFALSAYALLALEEGDQYSTVGKKMIN